MTSVAVETVGTFAYRAQTQQGVTVTGTIDAKDADDARFRLSSLNLRVFELSPAEAQPKPQRLSRDDFAAFNQQLAQLATAGLPLERGLRLIAQDMRSGRLSRSVHQVADDLERGMSLADAFAKHSATFPALYAKVVEAGVRAGNLPGILLNLGRHMELMQQLRRGLWRAISYPLMVAVSFAAVMIFISTLVVGPMQEIYSDFDTDLPLVTNMVFNLAERMPYVLGCFIVAVVLCLLTWQWARFRGTEQRMLDRFVLPVPLLGRILRMNLVARWCDAVGLAVEGGMDLPHSIELAGGAIGSPSLEYDGKKIVETHNAGLPLENAGAMYVLPFTVVAAIELGRKRGDLGTMLRNMTDIYNRQSEHALNNFLAVLNPVLLIGIATFLGFTVLGLFMPLLVLIQNISK